MIQIKIASNEKDIQQAKSLARELFPKSRPNFSSDHIVLLAYLENLVVGFIHIIPTRGRLILQGIGVKNDFQNKGVGSMLMISAVELFIESHLPVFLKVRPLNRAVHMYEKFGFFLKDFREDVCTLKWQENS
ncbi:MAG: GNAT family N-acetyltransferase [Candidatus Bilamarchaeum sp.]|jgi:ribosomal protein S18 acetylase RimI-like enzyme